MSISRSTPRIGTVRRPARDFGSISPAFSSHERRTRSRPLPRLTSSQHGPFTAVLDGRDANIHDCTGSDFVVTNIQQLASSSDRWLPQFPPDFFDMIIIDEGHHSAAESWRKTLRRFPLAKVVSLTATPFRTDRQQLPGEVIYRYSFARAMLNGYIKDIRSVSAAPSELYFTAGDEECQYSLAEVLEMREEAWFRRGVALSPECNRHIVEASIAECARLRERTGTHHQVIASACSIDHARQVRSLYEECGYRAAAISSDLDPEEQERTLSGGSATTNSTPSSKCRCWARGLTTPR